MTEIEKADLKTEICYLTSVVEKYRLALKTMPNNQRLAIHIAYTDMRLKTLKEKLFPTT